MTEPEWGTPEWHRLHPLSKIDFSKPLSETIVGIRSRFVEIRGELQDLALAYPGWEIEPRVSKVSSPAA